MPAAIVTVYVPASAEAAVVAAMTDAGAGRVGDYTGCSFSAQGTGRFTAPAERVPRDRPARRNLTGARVARRDGVRPREGARGDRGRCRCASVRRAARDRHRRRAPAQRRGTRDGVRGRAGASRRWRHMARHAGRTFGVIPQGVGSSRQARSPESPRPPGRRARSSARRWRAGVDALVAGEVRYHDALDAAECGPGRHRARA